MIKSLKKKTKPYLLFCRTHKQGFLIGEIKPYGSTYFPNITGIRNRKTHEIINQLVKECHVVSGHFFDAPNHIRIGLSKSENFEEAIKNLANVIKDIYLEVRSNRVKLVTASL